MNSGNHIKNNYIIDIVKFLKILNEFF